MPRAQDAVDKRTASASIDVYYEANLLCGEASSPSLEDLTRRALDIKEKGDRLFVHWTSPVAAIDCQAIGPVRAYESSAAHTPRLSSVCCIHAHTILALHLV